ncbi:hypothetical protein FOA52_003023 [Chlamydomonas sp. UWO 241]|nr:hypothetical protein FOA52_003023 [Chlamydomonas sp. UWO 241]
MRNRPCYTLEITSAIAEAVAAAQAPETPLDALLEAFVSTMLKVQPQGPYIVAGNRLAFSVAVELEARGCTVASVINMDDNLLWFDRAEVEKVATHRDQLGWIGMFKFTVLARVFLPGSGSSSGGADADTPPLADIQKMEEELDKYEAKYNELAATGASPVGLVVSEVTRWLGVEEGNHWNNGLSTLMKVLTSPTRPCARPGVNCIAAPIVVIKVGDLWKHTRIQEVYDPAGAHNYSWGPFTRAGAPKVHIVEGTHYSMGYDASGAKQLALLMDIV